MANMIMASSKTQIPNSPSLPTPKPKPQPIPQLSLPMLPKPQSLPTLKSISLVGAAAPLLLTPLPALAVVIEKAALFDFNLTLPIIMGEFLLLMFALDKLYFTPLGNFMDGRDAAIKEKLSSVKDTSEEVKQLEEQASAIMKAARAEISAALNKMKKETQEEVEEKLREGRKKVEAELQEALASLERQKEETVKALDSQIAALSQDIVKKHINHIRRAPVILLHEKMSKCSLLGGSFVLCSVTFGDVLAYAVNDQFSRVLSQQMEYYSNDLNADRIYQLEGEMSQVINDVLNPIWNQAFYIVVEDGLEDKLILAYRVFLGVSI
ncbi:hypothetical protein SAY86_007386 [Trapa natans]|uniref:ATP synthase subunit b', chloroplastic n=1 Tax=Trapa natans TaxID=22666 RepID=A0AAN7LAT3_TRANT|nr:hypothetical protein SAY86_007386 [Trapa natans]